jgi:hypothetical protein
MFEVQDFNNSISIILQNQQVINKLTNKNIKTMQDQEKNIIEKLKTNNIYELDKIEKKYMQLYKKTRISLIDNLINITNIIIIIVILYHFVLCEIVNFIFDTIWIYLELNNSPIMHSATDQNVLLLSIFMFANLLLKTLLHIKGKVNIFIGMEKKEEEKIKTIEIV